MKLFYQRAIDVLWAFRSQWIPNTQDELWLYLSLFLVHLRIYVSVYIMRQNQVNYVSWLCYFHFICIFSFNFFICLYLYGSLFPITPVFYNCFFYQIFSKILTECQSNKHLASGNVCCSVCFFITCLICGKVCDSRTSLPTIERKSFDPKWNKRKFGEKKARLDFMIEKSLAFENVMASLLGFTNKDFSVGNGLLALRLYL